MILAKIDVTKVDKDRLFPGKNGAKYLDVCLVETPNDQYGNSHMVVQSVSKEERERGVKGAILGNAKIIGSNRQPSTPAPAATQPQSRPPAPAPDDDIPF